MNPTKPIKQKPRLEPQGNTLSKKTNNSEKWAIITADGDILVTFYHQNTALNEMRKHQRFYINRLKVVRIAELNNKE